MIGRRGLAIEIGTAGIEISATAARPISPIQGHTALVNGRLAREGDDLVRAQRIAIAGRPCQTPLTALRPLIRAIARTAMALPEELGADIVSVSPPLVRISVRLSPAVPIAMVAIRISDPDASAPLFSKISVMQLRKAAATLVRLRPQI